MMVQHAADTLERFSELGISIEFLPRVQTVAVVGESDDSMATVHQESYPGQQAVIHARRSQQSHLRSVYR